MTAPTPTEAQVLKSCLHYLQLRGYEAFRMNTGGHAIPATAKHARRFVRFGKRGLPDICGYMPDGRALFVEVKSPTGKLRPEQEQFLERARAAGCRCVVARSVADLIASGL